MVDAVKDYIVKKVEACCNYDLLELISDMVSTFSDDDSENKRKEGVNDGKS